MSYKNILWYRFSKTLGSWRAEVEYPMAKNSFHRNLLCIIFSGLCAGCIVPWNDYAAGSRRNVREETAQMIIPGQTTKEEVYFALGAPDEVSPDGSRVVYNWAKVKALVGVGLGATSEAVQKSSLIITFNERGVVVQREVQHNFPAPW